MGHPRALLISSPLGLICPPRPLAKMMDDGPRTSPQGIGLSGVVGRRSPFSSPYLDFDPKIINPATNESQWIFPDGVINRSSRGRFELAFSQIGGSVMTGGALGGLVGLNSGLREVRASPSLSWPVRRSQILNYITKNGANTANAFGTVAVIYSVIGVGLSFVQESNDDINTLVSATTTGLLYGGLSSPKPKVDATSNAASRILTSTAQLRVRRAAIGGMFGLCLSAAYILLMGSDKYWPSKR